MDHQTQVKHAARRLELKRTGSHRLGLAPWRNPVESASTRESWRWSDYHQTLRRQLDLEPEQETR